jgi:hypothetical protein
MSAKRPTKKPAKQAANAGCGDVTCYALDDDRKKVTAGDKIRFCYGIPSVIVVADVIERDGKLIALTPGHHPPECNLRRLRRYVGMWFKHNVKHIHPETTPKDNE